MSKALHLDIDYPTPNGCARSFNKIFCSWGVRKTPYDNSGNIKGKTAPLWANPAKKFFLAFFILNFVCSLLFVAGYIVVQYYSDDAKKSGNDQEGRVCINQAKGHLKTVFIVIGSIILFVNSLYWLFIYLKDYASDQEWSRYMILLIILWCAMVGFLIAEYVISVDNLKYYNDNKSSVFQKSKKCKRIFLANLSLNFIVSIFNTLIAIGVIIRVIFISKDFFFSKYVPHSATCEDEDIIIIQ